MLFRLTPGSYSFVNKSPQNVNFPFFLNRDPEVLITASDDYTLKIWRSRHRARQLKLPVEEFPVGMEFRRRCSRLN
jgi:F-box/WD-40 domain protein 5